MTAEEKDLREALAAGEFELAPLRYRWQLESIVLHLWWESFWSYLWCWGCWSWQWRRGNGLAHFEVFAGPVWISIIWWHLGTGDRWERTLRKWKARPR